MQATEETGMGDAVLDMHDRLAEMLAGWTWADWTDDDDGARAGVRAAFKALHGVFDWHHDDPDVAAFYASIGACD